MIRVARGATGFWGPGDDPAPTTDVTLFRSTCWAAARAIGGRADEELTFIGVCNFHAVTVTGRESTHVVLGHAHAPVVAFLDEPPVSGRPLSGLVDPPTWADHFEAAGLRPLSAACLSTPVSRLDLSDLTEAEHAQIRYWRPEALSDLLFNWWD